MKSWIKLQNRAGKIAKWIKVFVTKLKNLDFYPSTHIREEWSIQSCPMTSTHMP